MGKSGQSTLVFSRFDVSGISATNLWCSDWTDTTPGKSHRRQSLCFPLLQA
jgi:hypothetical protein